MKLSFIKFANGVRVGGKVSMSAESGKTDIEIKGGVMVRLEDKKSKGVVYSSLFNAIEFKELSDTSTEEPQASKGSGKAKAK